MKRREIQEQLPKDAGEVMRAWRHSKREIIAGIGQWVADYVSPQHGFEPYMITFMFRLTMLQSKRKDRQMQDEISRVYSRFLTECVRNPWSQKNKNNRPVLIACQDWPVNKKDKRSRAILLPSEGAHCGGVLLLPPWHRLKFGVKDHFENVKRNAYVRRGFPLSRIHIEHISYTPAHAADYVMKSLRLRRCTPDDLVIFPRAHSERPSGQDREPFPLEAK